MNTLNTIIQLHNNNIRYHIPYFLSFFFLLSFFVLFLAAAKKKIRGGVLWLETIWSSSGASGESVFIVEKENERLTNKSCFRF